MHLNSSLFIIFSVISVMCPKGDDPLTINQYSRSLQLDVMGISALSGEIAVEFQSEKIYLSLTAPSGSQCELSFESNPKFNDITCIFTQIATNHFKFVVTINSWPLSPAENNLYSHNGNPVITEFLCDMSFSAPVGGVTCTYTDIVASNVQGILLCYVPNKNI